MSLDRSYGIARGWPSGSGQLLVGAPYVGLVADHCLLSGQTNSSLQSIMNRTLHIAKDNVVNPQVIFQNAKNGIPTASTSFSIKASIEYPVGTFIPMTFSGASTGSSSASTIISDPVQITIPIGTKFFVRTYYNSSSGIGYSNFAVPANGEGSIYSSSLNGAPDMTAGGTVTTSQYVYYPLAIVGLTTKATFLLIGDSRVQGVNDSAYSTTVFDVGEFARAISSFAYTNAGIGGTLGSGFLTGNYAFIMLKNYVSTVLSDYGMNDLINGASASTLFDTQQSIAAIFSNNKFFVSTLGPNTTSTDSWATLTGQTAASPTPQRIIYNNMIRSVPSWATGIMENADVTESARDSGLIKVTGSANGYTLDGLHWNPFAYGLFATQGTGATPAILMH